MKTQTFYVFIIVSLFLYACSTKQSDTKLPEETIKSQSTNGVALQLDKVEISDEKTLIQVSIVFDSPNIFIVEQWMITLKDTDGNIYPLTNVTPQDTNMGDARLYQTVPLQKGKRFILDLGSFPEPENLYMMTDFSESPSTFLFDPASLEINDSVLLNQKIPFQDTTLNLISVEKPSNTKLIFEFDSQELYNGIMLYEKSSKGSSESGIAENGKIIASLEFSEIPKEEIEIQITRLYYNVVGTWNLEFAVTDSMFNSELPNIDPTPFQEQNTATVFNNEHPLFLEVQALSQKNNQPFTQKSGWVHVVSDIVTETMQTGQTYPPPYYQEEYWFEVDIDGWVTRSLTTHWSKDRNILQQNISVGNNYLNLTSGEAMQFPLYQLSLDWMLSDLDYALQNNQTVLREETTCDNGNSCLLISINEQNLSRQFWIDLETGQQVKIRSTQNGNILFTQTFYPIEFFSTAPQEVLDLFDKIIFPEPQ